MTFDEYLQDEFTPKRLPSSWVTNTKFVFQSDDGSLAILDTANDSVTTLVTNHTMVSRFEFQTFELCVMVSQGMEISVPPLNQFKPSHEPQTRNKISENQFRNFSTSLACT